jgi:replication factor C subunit 2/4
LVGASAEAGDGAEGDKMDVDKQMVTTKVVEDIAGVIPDDTIENLVKAMRPRAAGETYQAIANVVEEMVADGWSAGQTMTQLHQAVVYDETIPDVQKNKIVMVFSEIDKRLVDGADEHLSILDLALRVSGIMAGR